MASKAALLVKFLTLLDSLDGPEETLENQAIDNLPEEFRDGFRGLIDHMEVDIKFLAY